MDSYIKLFDDSVVSCWDNKAVSQFRVASLLYSDFAREICVLQDTWEKVGLSKGDKLAINARSSANWITLFMASVTGGYVSVQLFNGFTPSDTSNLVNHSDSRILYTEKNIFSAMDFEAMPQLLAAIDTESGELLASRNGFDTIWAERYDAFNAKYPAGFSKEDYIARMSQRNTPAMDEVCSIMYTSGSTGNPKGVMLTVRNFSANVKLVAEQIPMRRGENHLSLLPYAHIFGLTVDAISALCIGMHLCILGTMPIPRILKEAFQEYKPKVFFAVPLVLSKYVDYVLGDMIRSEESKQMLEHSEDNPVFCENLRNILVSSMGGNIEVFVTGGAAIPFELEDLLAFKLKAPFISGYGMTECAPVISLGPIGHYKAKSCGAVIKWYLDVKIASPDPRHIPGEVMVKGDCVFKGYYKNEEATRAVLSQDGWLRTGDVGVLDEENILFLSGRCKNMLLSPNGQNIFPEEVEVVLNGLPYVAESLVVQRNNNIHAIVVPKGDAIAEAGIDAQTMNAIMQENISYLNRVIPKYSSVNSFELRFEPFAKTPKGSIKRFMYA